MNIYLFLKEKLVCFSLPQEVTGSFSFDDNPEEEIKLINIEAKNGQWVLYSTSDVDVINGDSFSDELPLIDDNFYVLNRNAVNYLIYVSNYSSSEVSPYSYDTNINLMIGCTTESNLFYPCPLLKDTQIKIHNSGGQLVLESSKAVCYINNKNVGLSATLKEGDQVNVYGLKLIFLNNVLLMNNPGGKIKLKQESGLQVYNISDDEAPKEIAIKDIDLYSKNDYFSKSPMLRRSFTTKKFDLTKPPSLGKKEDTPIILTVGPMLTMGATSIITLVNTFDKINNGTTTMRDSWSTIATGLIMLLSMLLWPILLKVFNEKQRKKREEEVHTKYSAYIDQKAGELAVEVKNQKEILEENLITVPECLNIVKTKNMSFWNKRLDQSDLLVARLGLGDVKLDVEINYSHEEFQVDVDDLREKVDNVIAQYKYIHDAPVGYSFHEGKLTAVMGDNKNKNIDFLNGILIQFLTFYSYEDLKIVVFTNESNSSNWEYLKYTNHCFDNERKFRFFSSTKESANKIANFLGEEFKKRTKEQDSSKTKVYRPQYLIIVDDYDRVKEYEFVNNIAETDNNLGFSMIIVAQSLSKLPSKCNNYIDISESSKSGLLKSNFDSQEYIQFTDEVCSNINYMDISRIVSNLPIEFEEKVGSLPDSISFLEMEKVGKVEQLNILNRWNNNDATTSLKAEVGVNAKQELMYLDLHEKYHGPHGLIAGTTGSGKSEFIITYILSMCINYSPNDVAFILIDYKGGGLALAFENKLTGVTLPHLAGTITNLDKAEMDRTLVSIDSEVKRRQRVFNEARDALGESTMDIYKYQRHFKDGRLKEPIPHLFIICDEFAELKAQQPDFMDNLISIARIGRSLGVHLILATQKPSGVVNDQIWSNTKFRVCLKVASEPDSNEMLKHPDAAHISQAGRYFLQVGYDEIYALGQSGWCGAKYYPSDRIVKQVDKSVNYINDCADIIRSVEETSDVKVEAQGEQLAAVMKNIIEVSNINNVKAKRLWLDNIPQDIVVDEIIDKYNIRPVPYQVEAIIGEYDAPELQQQGIVKYNFFEDGSAITYSNDNGDSEMFFNALIYSTSRLHTAEEVNFYIIDYGSESLRKFSKLPQVGGMVFADETEKYNSLVKMIRDEILKRKKLFTDYGGSYMNYIKSSGKKLPLKVIIINNYDAYSEANQDSYEVMPEITRDSARYGIVFIVSGLATNSIRQKVSQNFTQIYTYKLKDQFEYGFVLGSKKQIVPRDNPGRGILNNGELHEFQTASITKTPEEFNAFIDKFIQLVKQHNPTSAPKIPTLPAHVRLEHIKPFIHGLNALPIGLSKVNISPVIFDFLDSRSTLIAGKKIKDINTFVQSLLKTIKLIPNCNIFIFDVNKKIGIEKTEYPNYYTSNLNEMIPKLTAYIDKKIAEGSKEYGVLLIYDLNSLKNEVDDKVFTLFIEKIKAYEKIAIIGIGDKVDEVQYDSWYKKSFGSSTYGIWIGKGFGEQNIIKTDTYNNEYNKPIRNDMGYAVIDGEPTLMKVLDFLSQDEVNDNEE